MFQTERMPTNLIFTSPQQIERTPFVDFDPVVVVLQSDTKNQTVYAILHKHTAATAARTALNIHQHIRHPPPPPRPKRPRVPPAPTRPPAIADHLQLAGAERDDRHAARAPVRRVRERQGVYVGPERVGRRTKEVIARAARPGWLRRGRTARRSRRWRPAAGRAVGAAWSLR